MTLTSTAYAKGTAGTARALRADDTTREVERVAFEDIAFNPWDDDSRDDDELDDDELDAYALHRWGYTSRASAATNRRAAPRAGRAADEDDEPKGLARRWKSIAILAIACAGILGVATQALQSSSAAPQAGTLNYHWQAGYYLDNGWLCYGWSNGAYHCTQHWHKAGNTLVSDNPAWVPNISGAPQPAVTTASAPKTGLSVSAKSFATNGEFCTSSVHFVANISQWTVPPGCYGNIYYPNPANYVYRSGFGWCNWWPEVLHPGQPDLLWGGEYRRSSVPAVGAAIFFSGGVQGASSAGHYAEVVAIAPDHYWVLISEMNFFWRGGGWQHVDYRYIHVGAGVTFIYP
jgi:hypothetical protein